MHAVDQLDFVGTTLVYSSAPMGRPAKAECDVFMRTDAGRHAETKQHQKRERGSLMDSFYDISGNGS